MLLFRGLSIAGSCGELGELVSEELIIRLSGVRVPVGPPFFLLFIELHLGRRTMGFESPLLPI
jgi:hypothetical protein